MTEIPEVAIVVLMAFLAGGVVMNMLKEELPEERESRFLGLRFGGGSLHGTPAGPVRMTYP